MTHGRIGLLAFAGLIAAGSMFSTAQAQEGPNTGAISLSASLDWTNEYWFRGIAQEDQGIILQPGLDVGIALWSNDDFSVDAYVGTWNSLHFNNPTGTGNNNAGTDAWFEADWYGGFAIGLPMNLWADVSYIVLYGPDTGGIFAEEIDLAVGLDDSEMWGDTGIPGWTGLQPYVLVAFETDGASDYGAAGTGQQEEGIYLELGIAPGFTLVESEDYPIDLTIPMTLGLSIDDYYQYVDVSSGTVESDTFGFFDIGVVASMPLSFVPADYGSWSVSAGVHVLILNEDLVQGTVGDANYDEIRVVGTLGVGMEY